MFSLTQKCLPLLRAAANQGRIDGEAYKDPARIINVSVSVFYYLGPCLHPFQIGSIEGLAVPNHETYAYSASKAALHHLSRNLAGRLGWEGITSNTIACGPFESKSAFSGVFENLGSRHTIVMAETLKQFKDIIIASIPLQRIGRPQDVGGTAVFLASPAASWMNGATIRLDGGATVAMPAMRGVAKL